ncbi:ABC transporter permease [Dactylosporangium darangshiense]|uniref:ABC transporter permease subunit n=1 Tax=Dactylosporangium darangshiense TaxID=579108 RepID=A0ABP8DSS8_9ACTN
MRHALYAEWTKLRTLVGNVWAMIAVAGLLIAGAVIVVESINKPGCKGSPEGCPPRDTAALMLSGVHFAQIAAVALGVALVSAEFHPRMIRTTFAMQPRRGTVFGAKAAVVGATVLGCALLGVVGAVLVGRPLLTGRGLTAELGFRQLALSSGTFQRSVLGTALYLMLVGLLSVGVAAAIRHAGAAIGSMLTLLYGPYLVTVLVPMSTRALHGVQDASPMMAGLAVQTTVTGMSTAAPLHPWAGLGVLGAYAAAALVLGGVLFRVRDA